MGQNVVQSNRLARARLAKADDILKGKTVIFQPTPHLNAGRAAPNVVVVGPGSLGLLAAGTLARAGADVSLVARGNRVDALRKNGIVINGKLGYHRIASTEFKILDAADRNSLSEVTPDFVIMATKATDIISALTALVPGLNRHTKEPVVLLLVNGWGVTEGVEKILPGARIFTAAVMTGSSRQNATTLEVAAHAQPVQVGSLRGHSRKFIEPLLEIAAHGFWPVAYLDQDKIRECVLKKWLFNCCVNGLATILNCHIDEFLCNPHSQMMIARIASEIIEAVASAYGIRLFESGEIYLSEVLIPDLFPQTAAQRPSMAADVAEGRLSEIEFLNGAAVEMARRHGTTAIINDALVMLVRALEARRGHALGERCEFAL